MAGKGRESADNRSQLRDSIVGLNEIGQRILYAAESRYRLHEAAQCHRPGKIPRSRQHQRNDDGQLRIAIDVKIEQLRLAHELPIVFDDPGKPLLKTDGLRLLPAIKRNAFTVFANAHHIKTEIRFKPLLVKVEADELPSDEMRTDGTGR